MDKFLANLNENVFPFEYDENFRVDLIKTDIEWKAFLWHKDCNKRMFFCDMPVELVDLHMFKKVAEANLDTEDFIDTYTEQYLADMGSDYYEAAVDPKEKMQVYCSFSQFFGQAYVTLKSFVPKKVLHQYAKALMIDPYEFEQFSICVSCNPKSGDDKGYMEVFVSIKELDYLRLHVVSYIPEYDDFRDVVADAVLVVTHPENLDVVEDLLKSLVALQYKED